jgi:hypothetical protein
MRRFSAALLLLAAMVLLGCRGCPPNAKSGDRTGPASEEPSVRLYLLSSVAGALEPCGCTKDQLGGLDHLAAFLDAQRVDAPESLLLAAGPLWFIDPTLGKAHATQDRWKAEAIAEAMRASGLRAWAPGYNDWAGGSAFLKERARSAGATLLAAGIAGNDASSLLEAGELKIGVVGLAEPRDGAGSFPEGVSAPAADAVARLGREIDALAAQGAQLFVVLAAMQRGAALRLVDALPQIHLLLVGKPHAAGHTNTDQPPPEMIGSTLVIETANHAQTVAVVDVHARSDGKGPLSLEDAGGVKKAAQVVDVSRRIRELEHRINGWEKGGDVAKKDLQARKAELAELRKQKKALEVEEPAPEGSFFRYRVQEVREGLGKEEAVTAQILAYYKRVNAHNKSALAEMKPPEPAEGQAFYIGADACTDCHMEERAVLDGTAHAKAYQTLVEGFVEYNLDCVGCHVTGYGKPGGSTVTHNEKLRGVQCETCHGPGSKHLASPEDPGLITLEPDPKACVEQCHHPPHVEGFDAKAKMKLILGPGHGDEE